LFLKKTKVILSTAVFAALYLTPTLQARDHDGDRVPIEHVLLISIDGMHAVDYLNCKNGLATINGGASYCPNLAELGSTGLNYTAGSTTSPSDSFPGLMGIVSGATPRTMGVYYDVAYDRSLAPPTITTGNGVAGGTCTPGVYTGTTTEYEEGIDLDQTKLNGGAPGAAATDGTTAAIDPKKLPRDPAKNCAPVYPWNFVRDNTIFGVIHAAGGYTAWTDKHPAYSSVNGPGDFTNVNDFYGPEVNSTVMPLPGVKTPLGMSCATIPDPGSDTSSWTNSFKNIQCYDTLKVNSILHQIRGRNHLGTATTKVPTIFGMNFQTVSVGEKLVEKSNSTKGGYTDAMGTPTPALLNEIEYTDAAIGKMVQELKDRGLYESTLVIITAKHGQNPVDSSHYIPILKTGTSPATILSNANLLPYSESTNNPTGIGPTEDDISLLWLADSSQTDNAVALLEENTAEAGIGEIFVGTSLHQLFDKPGLPPDGDPRTPDIAVTPNIGVVYTSSTKKLAEHGGFSHDDTNVMLLLSNPGFEPKRISVPVSTIQVSPTILKVLGLDPSLLEGVRKRMHSCSTWSEILSPSGHLAVPLTRLCARRSALVA
jgi:hypothetical protein